MAKIPLAPAYFFAGPLTGAALYLFGLRGDFADCFNVQALIGLLKKGAQGYWVATMAFLGLALMLPFAYFVGGVVYFYVLGSVFKDLEKSADR